MRPFSFTNHSDSLIVRKTTLQYVITRITPRDKVPDVLCLSMSHHSVECVITAHKLTVAKRDVITVVRCNKCDSRTQTHHTGVGR